MDPIIGLFVLVFLFLIGFPVPYAIAAGSIVIMALSTGMKWMSITSIMIGGVILPHAIIRHSSSYL